MDEAKSAYFWRETNNSALMFSCLFSPPLPQMQPVFAPWVLFLFVSFLIGRQKIRNKEDKRYCETDNGRENMKIKTQCAKIKKKHMFLFEKRTCRLLRLSAVRA